MTEMEKNKDISTNLKSKKIKSFLNSNFDNLNENTRHKVYICLKLFLKGSKNINEFYQYLDKQGLLEGIVISPTRSRSFTPEDTIEEELKEYIRNKIPEISKAVENKND